LDKSICRRRRHGRWRGRGHGPRARAAAQPEPNACALRQVHGLLVGKDDRASDAMTAICSHLHVFRSWSAVEDVGRR